MTAREPVDATGQAPSPSQPVSAPQPASAPEPVSAPRPAPSTPEPDFGDRDPVGLIRTSILTEPERVGGLAFRTRLTFALIAAAILPLAAFGLTLIAVVRLVPDPASTLPRLLLLTIAVAGLLAVIVA
ncbi:MAG TPA: hypothetical protein VK656_04715, partial [Candidatus Acidoferrum sp.]|nr:hypothetical protein [Candidatus Acidoferrum sp.]